MCVPARHWFSIDMKTLRAANTAGLPVKRLLEPGETLKERDILFVDLRHRIAHGNLKGLTGFEDRGATDYSLEAREVALKHLEKAELFEERLQCTLG